MEMVLFLLKTNQFCIRQLFCEFVLSMKCKKCIGKFSSKLTKSLEHLMCNFIIKRVDFYRKSDLTNLTMISIEMQYEMVGHFFFFFFFFDVIGSLAMHSL